MDGFAVRAADVADAIAGASRRAEDRGPRDDRPSARGDRGRRRGGAIATGAPIPAGADAIVPIENAEVHGRDRAAVRGRGAKGVTSVRPARMSQEGTVLVEAGKRLGAPELGLLANAGSATRSCIPDRASWCSRPATS